MRHSHLLPLAAAATLAAAPVAAMTVTADTVIDYFDSGAGPIAGPYGIDENGDFPVSVPLDVAVDGNAATALSLPTDSFVTLGFSSATIIDGEGNDIFISEPGEGAELADVFVSSDSGATFTLLGQANGNSLTELDLADIGFTGSVNAVQIVGLDNGGGSPGFDVAFVQGLEGSVVVDPAPIPLPASAFLLAFGIGAFGFVRRRTS